MSNAKIAIAAALCAMNLASSADASIFFESEPNNLVGQANNIGVFNAPGDSTLVDGVIVPQDVDWFAFTVAGPQAILVSATFGVPSSATGDSILTLYAPDGVTILEQDDDDGNGNFSALQYAITAPGTYYLVVTGFPDFGNTGNHSENFAYKLSIGVNIVPAPGALALLGLAGLRRHRRRG